VKAISDNEILVNNIEELRIFWIHFLPRLSERCVLLFEGQVGAGKTTSVQVITEILSMSGVQSPSFAIHLHYKNKLGQSLDHLDFYRIQDDDDLESTGFWDLFSQKKGIIIVEWADKLNYDFLPLNWQRIKINFEKLSESSRKLRIKQI
jgi:tRNA threonylcarbamoyladenosine biosynthesis protein TsaE